MEVLQKIKSNVVVAVIRGATSENIVPIIQALSDGGIKIVEITVDTPKVLKLIELVTSKFSEQMVIGAGTVLDAETARAAIMAGSQFIFSPTVDEDTIKITKRYGVVSIPGALTPTEVLKAFECGGDIIKAFPANIFGEKYIKDIHGPLPQIPLMPTGGITLENIGKYIRAGAVSVGVGSALVNTKNEMNQEGLKKLSENAALFVKEVEKHKK